MGFRFERFVIPTIGGPGDITPSILLDFGYTIGIRGMRITPTDVEVELVSGLFNNLSGSNILPHLRIRVANHLGGWNSGSFTLSSRAINPGCTSDLIFTDPSIPVFNADDGCNVTRTMPIPILPRLLSNVMGAGECLSVRLNDGPTPDAGLTGGINPEIWVTIGLEPDGTFVAYAKIYDDIGIGHPEEEGTVCPSIIIGSLPCFGDCIDEGMIPGSVRRRTVPDGLCASGSAEIEEVCDCHGGWMETSRVCTPPPCPGCGGGFNDGDIRRTIVPDAGCPSGFRERVERCECDHFVGVSLLCTPVCVDGDSRVIPDASCPSGSRNQSCVGGIWTDGSCVPPGGVCVDGDSQVVPDASCPSGTRKQNCIGGAWVDDVCSGGGICTEGDDRIIDDASCPSGRRNQTCTGGMWTDTGCTPESARTGTSNIGLFIGAAAATALAGLFLIGKKKRKDEDEK